VEVVTVPRKVSTKSDPGEDGGLGPPDTDIALDEVVAVAIVGSGGEFLGANDRWCELTGWSRSELAAAKWQRVFVPLKGLNYPWDSHGGAGDATRSLKALPHPLEITVASRDGRSSKTILCEIAKHPRSPARKRKWIVAGFAAKRAVSSTAIELPRTGTRERHIQVIPDNSTDVISIVNSDGTWRSTSSSGAKLFGYSGGDFPGGTPLSAIHPDDVDIVINAYQELLQREDHSFGSFFEFRVRDVSGHDVWLETVGMNLLEDPAVKGVIFHSRDVTERHVAADELSSTASRLTSLVSSLFVGVLMADEEGRVIYANQATTRLFGLSMDPSDLSGRDQRSLGGDLGLVYRDPKTQEKRIEEIVSQRRLVMEERVELANGRTVGRSFVPIFDAGEFRGYLWLFRDLTAELVLAAQREYLLDVEKEQNARLRELDALKSELVASVSHELRTPLTSIVSFTNLLKDGLLEDSIENQREFLDVIGRNTERLLRLVDDLLLLDRLESNSLQLDIEDVDLIGLVEISVSSISPVAENKRVSIELDAQKGANLRGDVDRLGQLVDNLVANAVKFTQPGGRVKINVYPEKQRWKIEVSDTGIGIPSDEIGELFHRFFRASNARRDSTPGSGLGLVIALRIAELHNGTVDVTSKEGHGTTFTVTLVGVSPPELPASPLSRSVS
jgi:PAS domain S-box-containing protein